jgi:hypothetical protein
MNYGPRWKRGRTGNRARCTRYVKAQHVAVAHPLHTASKGSAYGTPLTYPF